MAVASGTIGLGLLSKLVGSGIQRAGSLIFQKIVRISRIEQSLKASYQRNPSVKTAVDDFETVIGNRYGQYTEALDRFLQELERSGIINSMVENALIGRSSVPTKDAFYSLHRRAFGESENFEILFDQMSKSFSVTRFVRHWLPHV